MEVQNNYYQTIIKKDIYSNLLFKLENFLKDNEIKMFLNKANSIGWNKSKICGHFSPINYSMICSLDSFLCIQTWLKTCHL